MQESSYLSGNIFVSIWSWILLTQIVTKVYKECLTLTQHQISIFSGITILLPMIRFFDTNIDVDIDTIH